MLHFVVPGDLSQLTGGYEYDRRIIAELRRFGLEVQVHELEGAFPHADVAASAAGARCVRSIRKGELVVIDGLCLPAFTRVFDDFAATARLVPLVHHPLFLETGLEPDVRTRLAEQEAVMLSRAAGILVSSPSTRRDVVAMGVPGEKIGVVEPGCDAPAAAAAPQAGQRSGPVRLLCVATVTERKGHILLVEALSMLRDLCWRLDCVGSLERSPEEVRKLHRAIDQLGLRDRVHLRGEVSPADLRRFYSRADLFVLASWHEGYGMALAEAMGYGVPVVSTAAGAIPQTVPAEAGVLVPPGDADALAGAVRRLVRDASARRAMGEAARRVRRPGWAEAGRRFHDELRRIEARSG